MANEVKKSSRVIDTWKQKKWYSILAPVLFGSGQIGETVAIDDEHVMGRTVNTSLMTVTGDPKKQNINGTFEIYSVKNGVAETRLRKLEILPSSVRRMIKKGKDRVDLSFICATKDNVVIRIKPLLVTRSHTGGSVLTAMRHMTDAVFRVEVNMLTFDELIHDILTTQFQKKAKIRLNKIYPLKAVEVRLIEITTTSKPIPPIPHLEELKEEVVQETEEEKIEKKVKAKKTTEEEVVEA